MDLKSLNEKLKISVDSNKKELTKLKNKYRKKVEENGNMPTSKKQSDKSSNSKPRYVTTPLDDIVNIKKKKAVANELDELIFEQEQKKKKREQGDYSPQPKMMATNPITDLFSKYPEKLKDVSGDDIMKMAMLNSSGKGETNPLAYLMMAGKNESQNGGILEIVQAVKSLREMSDEGQQQGGGGGSVMNDTIMAIILKQLFDKKEERPPRQERNTDGKLVSDLLGIISKQGSMEREMLMGKIKELEYRQVSADPLNDAKKMIDFVGTYKSLFGSPTKETLSHDIDLQRLKFEQKKEMRKAEQSDSRLEQVVGLIDKSIETFADALVEPAAKAVKQGLENLSQENPVEESYMPPEYIPEMEGGKTDYSTQEPAPEPVSTPQKPSRFRYAYTKEDEE